MTFPKEMGSRVFSFHRALDSGLPSHCYCIARFTSETGQTRRSSCLGMSASPPTPDVSLRGNEPMLRARNRSRRLFDHLVGEGEQRRRNYSLRALAPLRFITRRSLVDCTTGRSDDLLPPAPADCPLGEITTGAPLWSPSKRILDSLNVSIGIRLHLE